LRRTSAASSKVTSARSGASHSSNSDGSSIAG
jgi:hypothetical protein